MIADEITPDRIIQIRAQYGMSLSDFARRIGVSPASVSLWERGIVSPSRRHITTMLKMWSKEIGDEGY